MERVHHPPRLLDLLPSSGSLVAGASQGLFSFLAGLGVRGRSRVAAIAAFSANLLTALVAAIHTGVGFEVVTIIFIELLFANIRGNWVSARWEKDGQVDIASMRLNQTMGDKFADQLPTFVWPKVRFVFYVLAGLENESSSSATASHLFS